MDCSNRHEAHEVDQEFVIARGHPSEMFEFIEQTLDSVPFFIDCPVASVRPQAIVARRNDGGCPQIEDSVVEMLRVVCPIRDNIIGFIALDELRPEENLAPVSRTGDKA